MLTQLLCHIGRRKKDTVHFVNVTVLTGYCKCIVGILTVIYSALKHLILEDESLVTRTLCRMRRIEQHIHVELSNFVCIKIFTQEVYHHWVGTIKRQQKTFLAEAVPVSVVLGKHLGREERHRVDSLKRCRTTQTRVFYRRITGKARHHIQKISIIKHCTVKKNLHLCFGKILETSHAPFIVLKELNKCRVIGNKQRFTTCTCKNICIIERVDYSDVIVVRGTFVFSFQKIVDART